MRRAQLQLALAAVAAAAAAAAVAEAGATCEGCCEAGGSRRALQANITCPAGFGKDDPAGSCAECEAGKYSATDDHEPCVECEMNTYSAEAGATYCDNCPPGMETSTSGFPVCNCKSGHYFDTAKLRDGLAEQWEDSYGRAPQWDDLSCVACEDLLPEGRFPLEFKCPGGGSIVKAADVRARVAAGESVLPIGPAVAAPGFFLKAEECVVPRPTFKKDLCDLEPALCDDSQLRTCFTSHKCAGGQECFGILNAVTKELKDMADDVGIPYSTYPVESDCEDKRDEFEADGTAVDYDGDEILGEDEVRWTGFGNCSAWTQVKNERAFCRKMHEVALAEGIAENDLKTSQTMDGNMTSIFMYDMQSGCDKAYYGVIAKFREFQGSGVQNYCHIGHIGERCATCDVVDGHQLEKGADGLCHYCEKHSVWILTRGDLGAVFAYYIPYNLFMRSGSPDKLKSAMMASFMFFVQTVTLLATSDTGQATWFMSTKYVQDEGQSDYQKYVDWFMRVMRINLDETVEPVARNGTVASEEICPGMSESAITKDGSLSAYTKFIKDACFKSIVLLGGVFIWHHIIYHLFVASHLHWYIGNVLRALSPTWRKAFNWKWTAEIKVLYQTKQEVLDDMGRKQSKFLPAVDKVVKGSSGIMLDFHTSGILMEQAKEIQDSRDQASKVRARAQFKAADADGGGSLDREEMHQLLLDLGERAREKDVSAAFSKYAGGASEMDVEQFERWWMSRKTKKSRPCCGKKTSSCGRWSADPADFRPAGSVKGEIVISSKAECSIDADDGRLEDGIADQWFKGEAEDTYRDFMDRIAFMAGVGGFDEEAAAQDAEADHTLTHRQAQMKNRLNPGDPGFTNERVRVDQLDRLGESSLLVSFTVLPEHYTRHDGKDRDRWTHMEPQVLEEEAAKGSKWWCCCKRWCARKGCGASKDYVAKNAQRCVEMRQSLESALTHAQKTKTGHELSGLVLEILVDLKETKEGARYWRAIYMLAATVLYYPVIQSTLPIFQCYEYETQVSYDSCAWRDDGQCMEELWKPDPLAQEMAAAVCARVRDSTESFGHADGLSSWEYHDDTNWGGLNQTVLEGLALESQTSEPCLHNLGACIREAQGSIFAAGGLAGNIGLSDGVPECFDNFAECRVCNNDEHLDCTWDPGMVWVGTARGNCKFKHRIGWLQSDQSAVCGFDSGQQALLSAALAIATIFACVACPWYAYKQIKRGMEDAKQQAKDDAVAEGREVEEEERELGFCENIFLGTHSEPTRRQKALFEEKIRRDEYSSLYAMCEQRAYSWFMVDLMRKGAVTAIYTFGGEDRKFLLLVFFVLVAIQQDITQPYRGRTENLFAFMTLMFLIVLCHTATTVEDCNDGPMCTSFITLAAIVFLTLVTFAMAMFFNKRQAKNDATEADRRLRRAQDYWGDIAKDMLQLDPNTVTEVKLKEAFQVLKTGGIAMGKGVKRDEKKKDENKPISIEELKLLRDSQRQLYDTFVPGLEVGWDGEAQGKMQPLDKHGEPQTRRIDCFECEDEEVEEMIAEADVSGDNMLNYDEFVAIIYNSWDRKQETDKLAGWLFTEFHRAQPVDYQRLYPKKMCEKIPADDQELLDGDSRVRDNEWKPSIDIARPARKVKKGGIIVRPGGLWLRYKAYCTGERVSCLDSCCGKKDPQEDLHELVADKEKFKGMLDSVLARDLSELDGWHDVDEREIKPHIDLKSGVVVDLCDGAAHRANRARRASLSSTRSAPSPRAGSEPEPQQEVLEPVSVDLHAAVPGERP